MRPDGSSAPLLMRRPVESRVVDLLASIPVMERLRSAFIALTFVLILNDMVFFRESLLGIGVAVSSLVILTVRLKMFCLVMERGIPEELPG